MKKRILIITMCCLFLAGCSNETKVKSESSENVQKEQVVSVHEETEEKAGESDFGLPSSFVKITDEQLAELPDLDGLADALAKAPMAIGAKENEIIAFGNYVNNSNVITIDTYVTTSESKNLLISSIYIATLPSPKWSVVCTTDADTGNFYYIWQELKNTVDLYDYSTEKLISAKTKTTEDVLNGVFEEKELKRILTTNEIEQHILIYCPDTDVNSIALNNNLGSDKEENYSALVYLTWNANISEEGSKKMLKAYSDALADMVADEWSEIQEIAIIWTVSYNDVTVQCAYERKDGRMHEMNMESLIERSESDDSSEEVPHREGMYGISDKDVYDIGGSATFTRKKIDNDVTGNWRISTIADNIQMVDYALSYYNRLFMDDEEIHGIVNFNYHTTTNIQYMSGIIFVTVHEYVDGEEHDAKLMFSGMVLEEYMIYPDNGDIEKIK